MKKNNVTISSSFNLSISNPNNFVKLTFIIFELKNYSEIVEAAE
jgi:hypothetical protein